MGKPIVIQVTGYSNSGKTTLVSQWIKYLNDKGLQVSVIKHHGHSGEPLVVGDEGKDSESFRRAGATDSLVVSDTEFHWIGGLAKKPSLSTLISWVSDTDPDVILVEGFKMERYPKIVLVRDWQDRLLIEESSNVNVIVCWREEDRRFFQTKGYEAFMINNWLSEIDNVTGIFKVNGEV
ncbi:molybdopterin-guanine dinucleotide biosynthesis protein B [Alteribacter populi]|uniref:molybdopterin-guanine dinucleotide biosynthesis protein B n=1 Tax=Alteribacter populi TaxID=2011011 RepID=UPI000BBAD22D|nr:molybdopterin-guanine dinucleotide biosynthesis protein B [Alteribacter populi]